MPELDLNKRRERRVLGPGGEWHDKPHLHIGNPAFVGLEVEQVIGRGREVVRESAKRRLKELQKKRPFTPYPTTALAVERCEAQGDVESMRHLLRAIVSESDFTTELLLRKGDNVEFNPTGRWKGIAPVLYLLLPTLPDSPAAVSVPSCLKTPGEKGWDSIIVTTDLSRTPTDADKYLSYTSHVVMAMDRAKGRYHQVMACDREMDAKKFVTGLKLPIRLADKPTT